MNKYIKTSNILLTLSRTEVPRFATYRINKQGTESMQYLYSFTGYENKSRNFTNMTKKDVL